MMGDARWEAATGAQQELGSQTNTHKHFDISPRGLVFQKSLEDGPDMLDVFLSDLGKN